MDLYTKLVLTVIAVAVCAIAIKLFMPVPPLPPTWGEIAGLQDQTGATELLKRIPLVRVHNGNIRVSGGDIEVSGSVSIDR